MTKWSWIAYASLSAIVTAMGPAAFAADGAPTNQELEKRIEALEKQQQSEGPGWWTNTKISGRMYYNISEIKHETNGSTAGNTNNGVGFDIKRFYVGIDHKFDKIFSANITTDFLYDKNAGATQIYIKKAYLDVNIDPALDVRLGSTDLPWIPFVEGLYGYRHIENTLIDRTKFGTSADWGVHFKGKLARGMVNYALAVVNGAGYKKPPMGTGNHFKSVDIEGRVSGNWRDVTVGVGGYVGKLGKDVEGATTYHTADRFDAVAAYHNKAVRVGVEYFLTHNWNQVTSVASDKAEGYGAFASYQFNPKWSVFGKYEHVEPSKDLAPSLKENYYNVGVQYSPVKIVDFALVYKHDQADNGTIATSNGTIGGSNDGTYDEVGLFCQLRW